MFRTFKLLMFILWLIDILNIDFLINGTHLATFLDITLPINGLFWLLYWLLVPSSNYIIQKED